MLHPPRRKVKETTRDGETLKDTFMAMRPEREEAMVFNTGSALLDAIVLAVVARSKEGTYGYKITQDVRQVIDISESTLYPILRRLEGAQLLTVRKAEHNGRLRKYYHITPQGLQRLEDFKAEWDEIVSIYKFIAREGDAHE